VSKAPKKSTPDNRLQIRYTDAWLARLEDWRSKQRPIPNISESIRRLVDTALEAEKKRKK
jgi:hypothetical protein